MSYDSSNKIVMGGNSLGIIDTYPDTGNNYGGGDVTRGKRKGVIYLIKVL